MNQINFLNGSRSWWTHVKTAAEATHFIHDLFTSGDYTGCAVQTANRRALLENTALCERLGLEELNESYSTDTILFPIAALSDPEIVELFEALERYPLIDEELHSEIESEMEQECFASYGADDFREYLQEQELITEDQAGVMTKEQLTSIYFEASRHTNYNIFNVETGTSGHFNFESFGGLYEKARELLAPLINNEVNK